MRVIESIRKFLSNPFFSDRRTLFRVWALIGLIAGVVKMNECNNFLIFRGVFWHTIKNIPLFAPYPEEYFDVNHYGPLFSLVVAPFATLPSQIGVILWCVALSLTLYWAIRKLPFDDKKRVLFYWFCAHELLTALMMQQFNIAIAEMKGETVKRKEKQKEGWAEFWIILGTVVKFY